MHRIVSGLFALAMSASAALAAGTPILLWPGGAPGSEGRNAPETMRINPPDEQVLSNINAPSITAYLPDPKNATGAAVIVIPGGGHREIWITHEGYRVAEALAQRGIAAFVLRYRLSRADNSPYKLMDHSLADVQRAVRLVKSRAAEWNIDPERVGVMGFSAGGHLSVLAGLNIAEGNAAATDPIERLSSRPAFLGLIYAYIPDDIVLTAATPPTFMIFGDKDTVTKNQLLRYTQLETLGVPVELHVLSGVGHGFGIRPVNPPQVVVWPQTFADWLDAQGFLKKR